MSRLPYSGAAFLASFLAFSLELLMAKLLLPLFGGSAFVWTLSLMTFQGILLAAYLYADRALKRGRVSTWLLLAPIPFFPIAAPASVGGSGPLALLWALTRSAAVPFLALSTTSLVIQDAVHRSTLPDRGDPYFIYGASNAGALAGLLCYPLLLEPALTLKAQSWLWCALYLLCAALTYRCLPSEAAEPAPPDAQPPRDSWLWVLFSAASSAAMLACSNSFSYNLAAAPLLWMLPLAIYLLTFYLTFKRKPWLPSGLGLSLSVILLLLAAPALLFAVVGHRLSAGSISAIREFAILTELLLDAGGLFTLCMLCHGALARSKPAPAQAPGFYIRIALGGWLGSALIAVAVPALARHAAYLYLDWGLAGLLALAAFARRDAAALKTRGWAAVGLASCAALSAVWTLKRVEARKPVYSLRNFYGIYSVGDFGELRKFYHGNTAHGMQFLDRHLRPYPMSYYHPHSPLGELYADFGESFKSVGGVGLGVGSIAAYGRSGQTIDFYELDPDVVQIAKDYFFFLKDSRAKVTIIEGDARLSLAKREAAYDLLVLDAFTSDAIPLHLLTREAFALYLSRLSPSGLIACHISNRLLDLKPVLAHLADSAGLYGAYKATDPAGMNADEEIPSHWVVLSREPGAITRLESEAGWQDLQKFAGKEKRPWTDQYASVLSALSL